MFLIIQISVSFQTNNSSYSLTNQFFSNETEQQKPIIIVLN